MAGEGAPRRTPLVAAAGAAAATWCLLRRPAAAPPTTIAAAEIGAFAATAAVWQPSSRAVSSPSSAANAAAPASAASARPRGLAAEARPSPLTAAAAAGLIGATAARAGRRRAAGKAADQGRGHSALVMHGAPNCAGVVITGGAAGVGYAYADEFLKRGHRVVICDIKDPAVAVAALKRKHPEGSIYGTACDVSKVEDVKKLVQFVKDKIRIVHYWINNAGINGGRRRFTEVPIEQVDAVVKVNLGGILLCTHAAMSMMEQQAGVTSHVFNTVGSGVKGGGTPGYVAYGATKRGLPQMTESLVKEIEEGVQGYPKAQTPGKVSCHVLSPGMVFTDLLLNDSTPELRKFPFGVLAAQPEEVAEDLVPKILAVSGNGKSVEFLTPDKIVVKFIERFLLGKKSDYIDDDGNVIKTPGAQYQDNGVRVLY